jgi:hypothetical protein
MAYQLMADAVLLVHLAFALFALLGSVLVLRWQWLMWLHLPVLLWGIVVEWADWICPLTPLENWLRQAAGTGTYQGDFIARLLSPVLYPQDLSIELRYLLGAALVLINLPLYAWLLAKRR